MTCSWDRDVEKQASDDPHKQLSLHATPYTSEFFEAQAASSHFSPLLDLSNCSFTRLQPYRNRSLTAFTRQSAFRIPRPIIHHTYQTPWILYKARGHYNLASQVLSTNTSARLRIPPPPPPPHLARQPTPHPPLHLPRHNTHAPNPPDPALHATHNAARCRHHPRAARHLLCVAQDPRHDVSRRHVLGQHGDPPRVLGLYCRVGHVGV
jgi:hypothetical protein